MRGLTNEERAALLGETTTSEAVWVSLIARGLGAVCAVEPTTYEGGLVILHEADVTPLGELALRLDAAARAMGAAGA